MTLVSNRTLQVNMPYQIKGIQKAHFSIPTDWNSVPSATYTRQRSII